MPPAGAAIDTIGTITWTPTEAQGPGVFTFATRVDDNGAPNLSTTNTFNVTVNEVNTAPVQTDQADRTIDELSLLTVNDAVADTDLPANALSYELVTAPAGAVISAAGSITWTPAEAQGPGSHPFTVRVTDNGTPPLNATHSFTVAVSEVNLAPSLRAQANQTMDELTLLTVPNPGTDPDLPANGLTYTLTEAPAGAAIDAAGTITWTPAETHGPDEFTFTTKVTDNGTPPQSTTNSFMVTVSEKNTAPALAPLNNITIDPGQTVSFNAAATDGDLPANDLTWSLTAPPAGATIEPQTGQFRWRPTLELSNSVHTITVNVGDNGTEAASHSRSFTVSIRPLQEFTLSAAGIIAGTLHLRIDGPAGPD